MKTRKSNKGLSLIELLIALSLVGLVLSAAGMLYFSGLKGWERSSSQTEVQQNLRIAMHTLNSEIRKADKIKIFKDQKKIVLTYDDDTVKTYLFDSLTKEIRLGESGSTVAMHIEDCSFEYSTNLIKISLIVSSTGKIESMDYTFRIYTRGKEVHEY